MMYARFVRVFYMITVFSIATNIVFAEDENVAQRNISGLLQWHQSVELGLTQSGIIGKVPVKISDQVNAGQVLLSLEQSKFNADIQIAQAALKRNQAMLNEARREFERTKELHDQTLIASHEFELANNAYIAAQAAVDHAKAQLAQARAILKETRIIAPFTGRIVNLNAVPKQAVVNRCQAQPLMTLAKTNQMRIRAWLPMNEISKLQLDQNVTTIVQQQRYSGKIINLGKEVQEQQGALSYSIDVLISPNNVLPAGIPATIQLNN